MPTITLTKVAGNPTSISSTSWIPISYDDRQNIQHAVANELKGPGIEITKIEVLCRARNSASAQKRLQFGFKPALTSGRNTWATYGGGNVLDSAFVAVDGSSNGSYIYRTFTRVYDANTNAAAFAKFAGHILESFNNDTDIFFSIIQPTSGHETQIYMSGYWSITITYVVHGNVPSTDVSSAAVGETAITTTIEKIVPDSTTTINYKYGDTVLETVNLGAGTTDIYTPPDTLATTYFPNDLTGMLTIEAKTYLSGVEYGTVSVAVTLTLPTSAAPTCSCTPSMLEQVISGVNAYVQNQSGVQFAVSGSAKLGASIVGYSLLFDGGVYDAFPATVSLLTHSGTLSYTLTVTDSRGLTGTASGSIYVYPWQKPVFLIGFACARATLSGEIDDDAESMLYTMSVAASPIEVGGVQYNTLSYQIKSRPIGTETWDLNDPVYAPSGAYSMNPEELIMRGGNVAVYTAYQGYEFMVEVVDLFGVSVANYTIPTNYRQLVIGADGKSVAFGGAITGTAEAPNAAFYNPAHFYGGIYGRDAICVRGPTQLVASVITGSGFNNPKIVPFSVEEATIGTRFTLQADSGIKIGPGVQYVKFTISITWFEGATAGQLGILGYRINSGTPKSLGITRFGANTPYQSHVTPTMILPVSEGDVLYALFGTQAGNAGNISGAMSIMTVEAIG